MSRRLWLAQELTTERTLLRDLEPPALHRRAYRLDIGMLID